MPLPQSQTKVRKISDVIDNARFFAHFRIPGLT